MSSTTPNDIRLTSEIQSQVIAAGEEVVQNVLVKVGLPACDAAPEPGIIVVVGELSGIWAACLSDEFKAAPTMTKAIEQIIESRQSGTSTAAIIMGPGTDIQDTRGLIEAIEKLNDVEIPLFVISCNSHVDHRLLSQFAILSGGAYALLKEPSEWNEHCTAIIETVQRGMERIGFLTIETPALMDIEAFYSLVPQPGLVQLSAPNSPRRSLSFPILSQVVPSEQSFMLTIRTPRLQEGQYNLATIACRPQFDQADSCLAESLVPFTVDKPSFRATSVRPMLVSLHQKLQVNALLELMAQAYLREVGDRANVEIDPTRMSQVFVNLVGNAIKFTDRGSITVHQCIVEDELRISVSDTGVGIPADLLPHIFDKFYRVENVVHTKEGTGLGLALVRGIVDYHGGRVEVESQPNVGSVFTVYVPLVQRIASRSTPVGSVS